MTILEYVFLFSLYLLAIIFFVLVGLYMDNNRNKREKRLDEDILAIAVWKHDFEKRNRPNE